MRCDGCANWTVAKKTIYESGDEVETFRAPEGKGHCEALGLDTDPDFGCAKFSEPTEPHGGAGVTHISRKEGAPWQHWTMIPCPDCGGAGSSNDRPDDRCAGTGNVRLYDDGFIGDERTRKHPKEIASPAARPKCQGCGGDVDPAWVACPACGHCLIEPPAETEVVANQFPTA